jgi:N-glycosidase YbiA
MTDKTAPTVNAELHGPFLAAEINCSSARLRNYIADLQQRADPAGDLRRAHLAEETAQALERQVQELTRERDEAREAGAFLLRTLDDALVGLRPDERAKVSAALAQPQADQPGVYQTPLDDAFLIYFDDKAMAPEMIAGSANAESVARARLQQISENWHAHLFRRIATTARDSIAQPQAEPQERERCVHDLAYNSLRATVRNVADWLRNGCSVTHAIEELMLIAQDAERPEKSIDLPGFVKPDTTERVHFYEQDCYPFSNFSAFQIYWPVMSHRGSYTPVLFSTSEHLYHFLKFIDSARELAFEIARAPSAHEAFKLAERNKERRRADWDEVKVDIMREILRAKVDQHEYVRRKLLATADRELVEDSWRDDFWGWGPNRDGQNMLGKLWMQIRAEVRAEQP